MIDDSRYEDIIMSVAGVAAYKISGVASLSAVAGRKSRRRAPKSVQVSVRNNIAYIDIYLNAFSGVSVPDLAYDVQLAVKTEVERVTKYRVKAVNINVMGIVVNQ